jgi:hypothetical protein
MGPILNEVGIDMEPGEAALRRACKAARVGVYFSSRDRRAGFPHIHLRCGPIGLGSFRDCRSALRWLVPQEVANVG